METFPQVYVVSQGLLRVDNAKPDSEFWMLGSVLDMSSSNQVDYVLCMSVYVYVCQYN